MIYELYGVTDEEIRDVEKFCHYKRLLLPDKNTLIIRN